MKILHTVEYYDPAKGGSEEVVKQISERLVLRGHDVTVATSYHPGRRSKILNGVRIEQFAIHGNTVKGLKGDVDSFASFLKISDFDLILNYAAQSWPTDITMKHLDSIGGKKILMPMGYSKIHHPAYREYFLELPKYLKKYDKLIYTSPDYQDKEFGDAHSLYDRSIIIRNGAAHEEFHNSPIGFREKYGIKTRYMFISVANHYFSKGHAFVLKACRLLKGEDFSLVIIGDPPHAHPLFSCYPYCWMRGIITTNIQILRNVPREWVVSAYLEADAFLFGSMIECAPLVMYESFASRTPFITREVGNVKDHSNILRIVNNPSGMANELKNLMTNPLLYEEMAERAYSEFLQCYTWDKIANQFEDVYKSTTMR